MSGSFHERLDSRDNALNFLRLILAGFVIVSHASPIGGFGEELRVGGLTLGNLAVGGFFGISGYLITASRFRTNFFTFAWRRILRIFPGYWGCLLVVGMVFGAVAGLIRGGWTPQGGLSYVASNLSMIRTGDAFAETLHGAPFEWTWNGSLWTLRYELLCYVAVGLAFLIPTLKSSRIFLLITFAGSTALSLLVELRDISGVLGDVGFLLPYFLAGACLVRHSKVVPANGAWAAACVVTIAAVTSAGFGRSLTALPLAYICLWLGTSLPGVFRRIGQNHDLSYGVYLYGFPAQQMLVVMGAHHLGLPWFTVLSLFAVLPLALGSWFLIERPAMKLKALGPIIRSRVAG